MTTFYAKHLSTKQTPQTEPIPGTNQIKNSAGGYSFQVDKWVRLNRFLILGCENGSYYATERKLTQENSKSVIECIKENGQEVVNRIVRVSHEGRAPKNDPAIFALALAATFGDIQTKELVANSMPKVCRIGTHLFQFANTMNELRGWGRNLRRTIRNWYNSKQPKDLAYQVTKYQQRDGWSHRDLLRLAHPKFTGDMQEIAHYITKGWENVGEIPHDNKSLLPIWAFERAKKTTDKKEIVRLIQEYGLVRECIPTNFLNEIEIWEALLDGMPLTAMIRNLGKMSSIGLLKPLSAASKYVCERLGDKEQLSKARIHPLGLLVALNTYNQGHGEKGKLSWTPVQQIIDALDSGFYLAFKTIEPTNKRWLLALDVSGSMCGPIIAGMAGITPKIGSAAIAMITAAVEQQYHFCAFTQTLIPLNGFSSKMRLPDAIKAVSNLPFGGTDCSQPMIYALNNRLEVDIFVIYTDSETYANQKLHPVQALRQYRQKMGIPAKLAVCGMVSNEFSIADSSDAGMMDFVGFSSDTPSVMADFAR